MQRPRELRAVRGAVQTHEQLFCWLKTNLNKMILQFLELKFDWIMFLVLPFYCIINSLVDCDMCYLISNKRYSIWEKLKKRIKMSVARHAKSLIWPFSKKEHFHFFNHYPPSIWFQKILKVRTSVKWTVHLHPLTAGNGCVTLVLSTQGMAKKT